MGIRLYCGLDETKWSGNDLGNHFCISPIWGSSDKKNETRVKISTLSENTRLEVIQDSGAFSDSINTRLSFEGSLQRQIDHADKYGYEQAITHRASYDVLIDEMWTDGKRQKKRWSEDDAWWAVDETIKSVGFLSDNRKGKKIILSAQGVSIAQYLLCTKSLLSISSLDADDMFGLGGWCIIGMKKNVLRSTFRKIISDVIPMVAKRGLRRVHIWGVMYAPALGELLWMCNKHKLSLSTDSSGVHRRPYFGQWGYADWKDNSYERPQGNNEELKRHRALHTRLSKSWLLTLNSSKYYKSPLIDKERW